MTARTFSYGADVNQAGTLYLPDGPGSFPVVVLIHGGCWQAGLPGRELVEPLARDLQRSGLAVWNIEYRRLGHAGGGYPGTFQDTASAVDNLQVLAKTQPLDLRHVVAIGHSAGGHLALWAAARSRLPPRSVLAQPGSLPIQGVVTLAGINDLAAYRDSDVMACGGPATIDRLIARDERAGQGDPYADTSPANLLPFGVTQLIVSGDRDGIVPPGFGEAYAAAARKAGDPAETLTIAGADHFQLIDPASPAWARIKPRLLHMIR